MTKENIIETIKDYAIITIGVIIVAFGLQYFYSPNDLAAGGLSGMALIINHYVPMLSVGVTIFFGNLILYVIAFFLVGGDFGFKTIYGSVSLSVFIELMDRVFHAEALTTNLALATVCGGITIAFGLAIAFNRNASTGGTDILAKILNKYSKFNIGISLLMVDILVTICGALTFGFAKGAFALVGVFITGLLLDKFIILINKFGNREKTVETVLN